MIFCSLLIIVVPIAIGSHLYFLIFAEHFFPVAEQAF